MYLPKYFAEAEAAGLEAITACPFALLITSSADGLPGVTHIPMMLDAEAERPTLLGHVARANPHGRVVEAPGPALAIFSGPNGYISPNWYPSKHAGKAAVPTWNYLAVHVTGQIKPLPDYADKRRVVRDLSLRFEGDKPRAWKLDDEPEDFVAKMLGGITAFALEIEDIQTKAKLSQNRPELDRAGVIEGLNATGSPMGAMLAARIAALSD
jgi:transcriptional regulator